MDQNQIQQLRPSVRLLEEEFILPISHDQREQACHSVIRKYMTQ